MTDLEETKGESLVWRVHPAGERKGVACGIGFVIVTLSALTASWMGNIYWGFLSFMLLFLSLEAFFLPSRFELSEKGIKVYKIFSSIEKPWSHYRRVTFDRLGITISPFRKRNWLDSYRATRLVFSRKHAPSEPDRKRVRDFILQHIDLERVSIEGDNDQENGANDAKESGTYNVR